MVTPVLPLYVVLVLGEGADKVGVIVAIATAVSYALRILGGLLSDRFDKNKPFLLAGYGISAVAKPLFALAGSWIGIATIRSFERLGKAVRAAPKDRLISQSAAAGSRGKMFGLHKTLDVAGEMGGLLLLVCVLGYFGSEGAVFRNIFFASLIPGGIACAILLLAVQDVTGGKRKQTVVRFSVEQDVRRPIFIFAAAALFMLGEAFFLLRGNELGFSLSGILLFLIGMKGTQVMLSYQVGRAIDHYSSQQLLTVGYVLGVVSLMVLLLPGPIALGVAFVLLGGHGAIVLTGIRTLIANHAADKGGTFGFFYLIYAVAASAGAFGAGFVWEHQGGTVTIALCALGSAAVSLIHFLSLKHD